MCEVADFKNYLNCYEFDITLPGSKEQLKIKPITTGQLKKLLVYENEDDPMLVDSILDELIVSSVMTEGFNIDNITLQDRFSLLVELRKISKGNSYQFYTVCSHCESQTLQNTDLTTLIVKAKPDDTNYVVKLDDHISITLSYLTRGEQKKIFKSIPKTLTGNARIAEMATLSYAASIVNIIIPEGENELPQQDKIYLINNMTQGMYSSITTWMSDNSYGVEFKRNLKCKNCGKSTVMEIPLENFFF